MDVGPRNALVLGIGGFMKVQFNPQNKVILGLTVGFIAAFLMIFSNIHFSRSITSQSESSAINYVMAKTKSFFSQFTLLGREIVRENIELSNETTPSVLSAQVKKNEKKNEKAKDAHKNKNQSVVQNQKTKNQDSKEKDVGNQNLANHNVVKDSDSKLSADKDSSSSSNQYSQSLYQQKNNTEDNQQEQIAKAKTIEQWKNEILTTKSKEVLVQFVAAYKKGEVSESDFYSFVTELSNSSEATQQGLGLYALRLTPTLKSFTLLTDLTTKDLGTQYQAYVKEALLSYHQSNNLYVLKQALTSKNKNVVLTALSLIKTGYESITSDSQSTLVEARYRRDQSFSVFNLQNYAQFIQPLKTLVTTAQQTSDSQVLSSATQVSQLLSSNSLLASVN